MTHLFSRGARKCVSTATIPAPPEPRVHLPSGRAIGRPCPGPRDRGVPRSTRARNGLPRCARVCLPLRHLDAACHIVCGLCPVPSCEPALVTGIALKVYLFGELLADGVRPCTGAYAYPENVCSRYQRGHPMLLRRCEGPTSSHASRYIAEMLLAHC